MKTEKELIIETAQVLDIFRDATQIAFEKHQPAPEVYPIAEDIVHKCLGTKQILTQSSMLNSSMGNGVKAVFKELDKLRGYKPPKRQAEAASILRMLKKKFKPQQIIDAWETLKKDKFWQGKELFMMTVESQIGAIVNKHKPIKNNSKFSFEFMVCSNCDNRGRYVDLIRCKGVCPKCGGRLLYESP